MGMLTGRREQSQASAACALQRQVKPSTPLPVCTEQHSWLTISRLVGAVYELPSTGLEPLLLLNQIKDVWVKR